VGSPVFPPKPPQPPGEQEQKQEKEQEQEQGEFSSLELPEESQSLHLKLTALTRLEIGGRWASHGRKIVITADVAALARVFVL